MSLNAAEKVEFHIQNYIQNKLAKDKAEEEMAFAKDRILDFFKDNEDSTLRVGFDQNFDVKVTYGESNKRKFDKDKLADDMNVEPSVINRDFLIKAVDDRKLSFEEFNGYHFNESAERLSIRLVQAEGK